MMNNVEGGIRDHKRFLNVKDVCNYTSLCKSSIYKKVHDDAIPYIRIKKRIVFDTVAIDKWMLNGGQTPIELPDITNL